MNMAQRPRWYVAYVDGVSDHMVFSLSADEALKSARAWAEPDAPVKVVHAELAPLEDLTRLTMITLVAYLDSHMKILLASQGRRVVLPGPQ